ncbi:hypothetical protein ACWEOR_17805, partial [Micromonospora chalcea]
MVRMTGEETDDPTAGAHGGDAHGDGPGGRLFSQGGAFVNNLICGTVRLEPELYRATPNHL